MIASKLILFFCFYILLLLDKSLSQKALVELDGNKGLFKRAMEFGQTYRGELGELGSQWKQLLIQLVQAKRNVGLGKYQLSRFNESATTEEVGLAITDNYADKVAELAAIRTLDIGTIQKYIDDLEILKNEIALTMIVKMDELEEKLKEQNVRKKVKEAKENGLTDEDIKELLFAEFIESGGLSPIDAAASIADRLLSSFRYGLEIILYGTYDKNGIIQYGNYLGGGVFLEDFVSLGRNFGAAGGNGEAPTGDGGAPGGTVGGGGSSGGPPDGPPTGPPTGPPSSADVPDEDEEDDKNETDVYVNKIRYTAREAIEATQLVDAQLDPFRTAIDRLNQDISDFRGEINRFLANTSFNYPQNHVLSQRERLNLYNRRIEALNELLRKAEALIERFNSTRANVLTQINLAIANYGYYTIILLGDPMERERNAPDSLPEFEFINAEGDDNVNRMRYYIAWRRRQDMFNLLTRFDNASPTLSRMRNGLRRELESEKAERDHVI